MHFRVDCNFSFVDCWYRSLATKRGEAHSGERVFVAASQTAINHSEDEQMKLALVDGHQLFREGFGMLVAKHPDMTLAGHVASPEAAYALVDATAPDVIVMEVTLVGGSGLLAGRELLRRGPGRRLMYLTSYNVNEYAAEALHLGAKGFALKTQSADDVFGAIRTVGGGGQYLAPTMPRDEIDELMRKRKDASPSSARDPLLPLSHREKEVFGLLVHGDGNHAVATRLGISVRTVETHRAHILRKLNVHSLSDMVRLAVRHGLFWEDRA